MNHVPPPPHSAGHHHARVNSDVTSGHCGTAVAARCRFRQICHSQLSTIPPPG